MNKRTIGTLIALLAFGVMFVGNYVSAADKAVGYSFTVGYNQNPGTSSSRYRETTNKKNCWKANMTYSAEGQNTVMNFWLAKKTVNASDKVPLRVGGVTKYRYAYDNAAKTNVNLKAINNNYVPRSYSISGYWDEETGVTKEKSVEVCK